MQHRQPFLKKLRKQAKTRQQGCGTGFGRAAISQQCIEGGRCDGGDCGGRGLKGVAGHKMFAGVGAAVWGLGGKMGIQEAIWGCVGCAQACFSQKI